MRLVLAASVLLIAGVATGSASPADPYPWCAEYSMRGGATNCYFMTEEQCKATVSGVGGYCRRNLFYTGGYYSTPSQPRRKPRY
jgi:hypothetical protein